MVGDLVVAVDLIVRHSIHLATSCHADSGGHEPLDGAYPRPIGDEPVPQILRSSTQRRKCARSGNNNAPAIHIFAPVANSAAHDEISTTMFTEQAPSVCSTGTAYESSPCLCFLIAAMNSQSPAAACGRTFAG